LPDSSVYGPVLGPVQDFNLPGNWSTSRDRSQPVPSSAPAGTYSYNAYIGVYPDIVSAQDSFTFEKSGSDGVSGGFGEWTNNGDEFESGESVTDVSLPDQFIVYPPHPNPFNPTTVFRFDLPEAAQVTLEVFDVFGRRVGVGLPLRGLDPTRRYAPGTHEITFDGSRLPSGLYFYRLTLGSKSKSGKIILLK
jgi:hypothetical protein